MKNDYVRTLRALEDGGIAQASMLNGQGDLNVVVSNDFVEVPGGEVRTQVPTGRAVAVLEGRADIIAELLGAALERIDQARRDEELGRALGGKVIG